jgi:hypothetical protein
VFTPADYIIVALLLLCLRNGMPEKRIAQIAKRMHAEGYLEQHNTGARKLPDDDVQSLVMTRNMTYLMQAWHRLVDPLLVGGAIWLLYMSHFWQ